MMDLLKQHLVDKMADNVALVASGSGATMLGEFNHLAFEAVIGLLMVMFITLRISIEGLMIKRRQRKEYARERCIAMRRRIRAPKSRIGV